MSAVSIALRLALVAWPPLAFVACEPGVQGGAAGGEAAGAGQRALSAGRLVDLTHPFDSMTIYWPTSDPFQLEVVAAGMTEQGYYYAANRFCTAEHGGTHLDAPVHFAEGRWTSDQIPLERLVAAGAVVDVSAKTEANADYRVGVEDLEAWEAEHGRIPDGAILLLNTGWARFWPDAARYMGTAERGVGAVPKLHFPGLHPDAARWLVVNRAVAAVGLDTPSIDFGQSQTYETHQVLFAANIPAFENVADLGALPPTGSTVIALPIKIAGGTGGPLRIIAVVPEAAP